MSSMSQQSHWLAKNRMSCTWSEHVGETPFDGVASQVGWGGGNSGGDPIHFYFVLEHLSSKASGLNRSDVQLKY